MGGAPGLRGFPNPPRDPPSKAPLSGLAAASCSPWRMTKIALYYSPEGRETCNGEYRDTDTKSLLQRRNARRGFVLIVQEHERTQSWGRTVRGRPFSSRRRCPNGTASTCFRRGRQCFITARRSLSARKVHSSNPASFSKEGWCSYTRPVRKRTESASACSDVRESTRKSYHQSAN